MRNIPVLIRPTGDDFVATIVGSEIGACGNTRAEAVSNLKDIIRQKFDLLGNIPEEKLAKIPRRQLAVLRKFIKSESGQGPHRG